MAAPKKSLRDFAETETSLSRSITEQSAHEFVCMSHQFAHLLTQPPFTWSFDELKEEFRAEILQRGDTVLVLFHDLSVCEFTKGSITIQAHEPAAIDSVMRRVSQSNPATYLRA